MVGLKLLEEAMKARCWLIQCSRRVEGGERRHIQTHLS